MFCFQCEQTWRDESGAGCSSSKGNCGKDAVTSDLQDLLIYAVKGIAQYAVQARALGAGDGDAGPFIVHALFTTLTNVNFSATRFTQLIDEAIALREKVRGIYAQAARAQGVPAKILPGPAAWLPAKDKDELLAQAAPAGINHGKEEVGEDVIGLRALILYALKGIAAYSYHAHTLDHHSDAVFQGVEEMLDYLAGEPDDVEELLAKALEVGTINLKTMELLDGANTGTFGHPEPTSVRITPVKGKAILVSGHEFGDLAALLEQTKGLGINIYTHGEMLPAHSYPLLKAYPHLAGNYGGAWQDQQKDFAEFPGPVLMTSNCMIEPGPKYRGRIFTAGPVGWPGVRHLTTRHYSEVIKAAQALPGFKEDGEDKTITIGFGRNAVLGVSDQVISAIKAGDIRHFFLMGGCDGARPGRNYYTELAEKAPDDTVLLTLGCNKFRFNTLDLGTVAGLPRLLDMGQCSDSYSAIRVAGALAEAFGCGLNDLPLSLVLGWFEQKAAAVLLTLLSLGVRNIRLGPTLPAFLTPNVVNRLVDAFGIQPIGTADADLAAMLAKAS